MPGQSLRLVALGVLLVSPYFAEYSNDVASWLVQGYHRSFF